MKPGEEMSELLSLDQLRVGARLKIISKNGCHDYGSVSIKKIIPMRHYDRSTQTWSEPYDYEILINRTKNYYFSFNNLLADKSCWVKKVFILEGLDKRLKATKNES